MFQENDWQQFSMIIPIKNGFHYVSHLTFIGFINKKNRENPL